MKKLFGNTGGLKANQVRRLENLYRRRIPAQYLITPELARDVSRLSHEIHRQIGLLINRSGKIVHVLIGDHQKIVIPDLSEFRTAPGRLKGLRCIHTHLKDGPLTQDDLTDLALLRLDMMAAIGVAQDGLPRMIYAGHIMPNSDNGNPYQEMPPMDSGHIDMDMGYLEFIQALETELAHVRATHKSASDKEKALLISVTTAPKPVAMDSLAELKELAVSGGIHVADTVLQQRKQVDSRFLLGRGKLQEISVTALQNGTDLLIFDQELNPSQIRSITDQIDLKIIDRTQLILDIFAQRAQSREGKLQVELAQLKYLLPRLLAKNTAMSRLTGGIGGRGPGETKLEINRRRARDRIAMLEKELSFVRKHRGRQRAKRSKKELPIISIIGYTNAGKSTLLNTLTKSNVQAESRLFATLDPTSRRLKFPRDMEVIITDTVGFIKNLPKDLMVAFRATLEELENADLLLHVVDISNPRFPEQVESVETIVSELQLQAIPIVRVLNKADLVDKEHAHNISKRLEGICVCAKDTKTLQPLTQKMATLVNPVWEQRLNRYSGAPAAKS